jgi:hypothetical protein
MKNYIKYSLMFLLVVNAIEVSAQINTQGNFANILIGENAFLDASGFEGAPENVGKGINFPRTNLTTFTFITGLIDSSDIINSFDGLIVFNSVTGVTVAGQGIVTEVVPGFYFFSNPGDPGNITGGQWKLIGDLIKNISPTTELTTAISVDGVKVYATKGTFTTVAGSATTTIAPPAGITGIYRITIYKNTPTLIPGKPDVKAQIASSVYDFDITKTSDNVITGDYPFSEVYPAGTYNYTLEYFK